MPLIRNGELVADPWRDLVDDEALPADGPVHVSFGRWLKERDRLLQRAAPVGVRVANSDLVDELAADTDRLALVVLEFPKFNDGRAYSQARILRERLQYKGELRARGRVLRDQLLFMHRCGFDAYEVQASDAPAAWRAALAEYTVFYQPTADRRPAILRPRA